MRGVAVGIQADAEKFEARADPLTDRRRVLADAAGKDQRVQPAERRDERAEKLVRLIAEQLNRLGRAWRRTSRSSEIAHVARSTRDAEEAGLADRPADRARPALSPRACEQVERTPGSRSPVRVPIIKPPVGVKPIVVSTPTPSRTAAMLAPLPRWAMTTRPRRHRRSSARSSSTMYSYDRPWNPSAAPPLPKDPGGERYIWATRGMSR